MSTFAIENMELAQEIRAECIKNARKASEVIQCMVDEGYLDATEEQVEQLAELVAHLEKRPSNEGRGTW